MSDIAAMMIEKKFNALKGVLDEYTRWLWAAAEAKAMGRGGISIVANATWLSRTTIHQGIKDLTSHGERADGSRCRIRAPGGRRKSIHQYDPTVMRDIEST